MTQAKKHILNGYMLLILMKFKRGTPMDFLQYLQEAKFAPKHICTDYYYNFFNGILNGTIPFVEKLSSESGSGEDNESQPAANTRTDEKRFYMLCLDKDEECRKIIGKQAVNGFESKEILILDPPVENEEMYYYISFQCTEPIKKESTVANDDSTDDDDDDDDDDSTVDDDVSTQDDDDSTQYTTESTVDNNTSSKDSVFYDYLYACNTPKERQDPLTKPAFDITEVSTSCEKYFKKLTQAGTISKNWKHIKLKNSAGDEKSISLAFDKTIIKPPAANKGEIAEGLMALAVAYTFYQALQTPTTKSKALEGTVDGLKKFFEKVVANECGFKAGKKETKEEIASRKCDDPKNTSNSCSDGTTILYTYTQEYSQSASKKEEEDVIILHIKLKPDTMIHFKEMTWDSNNISAALNYAQNSSFSEHALTFRKNGVNDKIFIESDGVSNEKGTKTDITIILDTSELGTTIVLDKTHLVNTVNKIKNGKSTTALKYEISLKTANTSNFQQSGIQLETLRGLFGKDGFNFVTDKFKLLNISIPDSEKFTPYAQEPSKKYTDFYDKVKDIEIDLTGEDAVVDEDDVDSDTSIVPTTTMTDSLSYSVINRILTEAKNKNTDSTNKNTNSTQSAIVDNPEFFAFKNKKTVVLSEYYYEVLFRAMFKFLTGETATSTGINTAPMKKYSISRLVKGIKKSGSDNNDDIVVVKFGEKGTVSKYVFRTVLFDMLLDGNTLSLMLETKKHRPELVIGIDTRSKTKTDKKYFLSIVKFRIEVRGDGTDEKLFGSVPASKLHIEMGSLLVNPAYLELNRTLVDIINDKQYDNLLNEIFNDKTKTENFEAALNDNNLKTILKIAIYIKNFTHKGTIDMTKEDKATHFSGAREEILNYLNHIHNTVKDTTPLKTGWGEIKNKLAGIEADEKKAKLEAEENAKLEAEKKAKLKKNRKKS
jgi:hypothetical protein